MIDSHCHLDGAQFADDLDAVIQRANAAGVVAIVTAGADVASSRAAVRLAERYASVYAVVGIHPHALTPSQAISSVSDSPLGVSAGSEHAEAFDADTLNAIRALANHPRVVGIGEIGLDFHYRAAAPRAAQEQNFIAHLELAAELGKPVVIHDRDAHAAVMDILERTGGSRTAPTRGMLHCFSGDRSMAERAIELGYYLSFAGNLTFQNAQPLQEIARAVPLDRVVIETDAPYLAPHPQRGKRNEPANVARVAEKIAEIKGLPLETVRDATARNSEMLFGLQLERIV